jgi:PAS domain S-box-containing protein
MATAMAAPPNATPGHDRVRPSPSPSVEGAAESPLGKRTLAEILVESSVDGLAVIDRDSRYVLWNRAMERFTAKRADEVIGRRVLDIFPALRAVGLDVAIQRALAGEAVTAEAVPTDVPDGARRYYDRLYLPLRGDDDAILGMLAIVRDATSRRNAEDALRAREEQLRLAADGGGVGLWSWDTLTDVVRWEPMMCTIFGLPEGGAPKTRAEYLALIHPDDRERSAARTGNALQNGRGWNDEFRIVRPDGVVRWVMTKASVMRDTAVGALIDVTERRERDEQLRQAQKLEAVGQLTAGIAHNFNNMLMGILPNLERAVRSAPAELQPALRDAEESGRRAAHLVAQLMTYAGRNAPAARVVEPIAPLVERTLSFCRTTFDQRIVFHTVYDPEARARVEPSQIEQALLNTLINARDAVVDVEAPRVSVSVEVVAAGAAELGARAGEHVRVRVVDNGAGIDPATAKRVFEPFFTTKPVGKGTGLGLATTYAIAAEHGGFVTCDSPPGEGATFSLYFPREIGPADEPQRAGVSASTRGNETVLVVDDEGVILRLVGGILSDAGFTTMLEGSGDAAIDRLADPRVASQIALAILDLSMPGVSGVELRSRVRELAPQARVLYFSGYAFDAPDVDDDVLQKPTTSDRLLAKVREILDRPARPSPPSP